MPLIDIMFDKNDPESPVLAGRFVVRGLNVTTQEEESEHGTYTSKADLMTKVGDILHDHRIDWDMPDVPE